VTAKSRDVLDVRHCPLPGLTSPELERRNAVFVHPGMVWVSDSWDQGAIVTTAQALKEKGLAGSVVAVTGRNPQHVYDQMLRDPGTQFVGLHYSLGGKADLLERSYEATRRASSENSVLRGQATNLPEGIISSPNVNFVYAEDVGEAWGHFSILPSGRIAGSRGNIGQSGDSPVAEHKTLAVLSAFFALAQGPGTGQRLELGTHCLTSRIRKVVRNAPHSMA